MLHMPTPAVWSKQTVHVQQTAKRACQRKRVYVAALRHTHTQQRHTHTQQRHTQHAHDSSRMRRFNTSSTDSRGRNTTLTCTRAASAARFSETDTLRRLRAATRLSGRCDPFPLSNTLENSSIVAATRPHATEPQDFP